MRSGFCLAVAAVLTAAASHSPTALAQVAWPTKPLRVIVASSPGGNADVVMRLIAPELEKRIGQSLIIENLAAASGMQGTEAVAKAVPDGHTLLVGTASQLVFNLALFDPMPFDLVGSLRGVALLNAVPLMLMVNPDDPAKTMQEYIARVKGAPGKHLYGSGPQGTTTHIVGLMWARAAGVDVRHVPYKAGAEGLRDLMAGRLSHQFDVAVTAIPHLQSGALRALATTGRSRLPAVPEVPTAAESGLKGFSGYTWNSIAVPARTPQSIVDRLNKAFSEVLAIPALRERLASLGSAFFDAKDPAQVDSFYASERALWVPLVQETHRKQR